MHDLEKLARIAFEDGIKHEKSKENWDFGGEQEPPFEEWYKTKHLLLYSVSSRFLPELENDFIEWVKENCIKITDTHYHYNRQDYLYTDLPELYVKETE